MENAALLYALVDNAIDGIITIDDTGIIESINPSACVLFAYSQEELIGKNISVLMPSPNKEAHNNYLQHYKKSGEAHIIGIGRELIGQTKQGNQFPFKLGVSEVKYRSEERRVGKEC